MTLKALKETWQWDYMFCIYTPKPIMPYMSLPVAFGTETAKWICVGAIDVTQLSVAGYLLGAGKPLYALALLGLILPQVFFQDKIKKSQSSSYYNIKEDALSQVLGEDRPGRLRAMGRGMTKTKLVLSQVRDKQATQFQSRISELERIVSRFMNNQ